MDELERKVRIQERERNKVANQLATVVAKLAAVENSAVALKKKSKDLSQEILRAERKRSRLNQRKKEATRLINKYTKIVSTKKKKLKKMSRINSTNENSVLKLENRVAFLKQQSRNDLD